MYHEATLINQGLLNFRFSQRHQGVHNACNFRANLFAMANTMAHERGRTVVKVNTVMKKTSLNIAAALGLSACILPAAHADFIGFTLGAGGWGHDPSGDISYSNSGLATTIDIEDDLGLGKKTESMMWASFEHPVPFLPNVKLMQTKLSSTGDRALSKEITFGDETYTANAQIRSDFRIDQLDAILYYEILDNWVNLDLGVNVKMVDAEFQLSDDNGNSERKDISFPVPMLYAAARFDLPFTGFFVGGEGSLLKVGDNGFTDLIARVGYESSFGIGLELGLREQKLKIEDEEDVNADMTFSGAYAAVFYHF